MTMFLLTKTIFAITWIICDYITLVQKTMLSFSIGCEIYTKGKHYNTLSHPLSHTKLIPI